ncbi:MAG: hypothetical protein ACW98Y_14315 [Candidatus Thorarchaeota archaeon]|jgi:hypothetical protein
MSVSKTRYFVPALFFAVIGGSAAFIIYVSTGDSAPPDVMGIITGISMPNMIMIILGLSIPILIIEYLIFAVPLAAGFLFVNRIAKAASYEMNIMNIGRIFGGRHMIRRAAAPALFSVAFSNNVFVQDIVLTYVTIAVSAEYAFLPEATLSLMSALLFMPIALLIFMPTWVLNDSGIVTHLKESRLNIRQCPDTQGVGRWVSNIFGGYALIAFPISMFTTHFYEPYILGSSLTALNGVALINIFLLTIGLPLFVMAFILPVIAFNERRQTKLRVRLASLATGLGATIIRREKIEYAQRVTKEGILTEEAGKEIVSTAKTVAIQKQNDKDVVTSRKSAKTKKRKNDSKKKKKK